MGFDVTASREIAASPADVAAVQFDPLRDPGWIGGVDRVEWMTSPPLAEGSQIRRIGGFMGRPIEWVMNVEQYDPDRLVAMRALKSPFPMHVDYILEPTEAGQATLASIRIRGEGAGMYRLPSFLLGPMVRRSVSADLRRLDSLVIARSR